MPFINRCSGGGGAKVLIDGEPCKEKEINLIPTHLDWKSESTMPAQKTGCTLDNDGYINFITSDAVLYKYVDGVWSSINTVAVGYRQDSLVLDADGNFNSKVTIYNGNRYVYYLYKYVDGVWSLVATLPNSESGSHLILDTDGYINMLGGSSTSYVRKHYKLVDNAWTTLGDLPYSYASAPVLDNMGYINLLGCNTTNASSYLQHYKLVDTTWSSVSSLPFGLRSGSAVLDKKRNINIMGGLICPRYHFKYVDGEWVNVGVLTYDFVSGSAFLDKEGIINILGGNSETTYYNHYKSFNLYSMEEN